VKPSNTFVKRGEVGRFLSFSRSGATGAFIKRRKDKAWIHERELPHYIWRFSRETLQEKLQEKS
jgi:hypothetical protein